MKPNPISLIFLLLVGCDYDLPNQFTSVQGTVSDYYTQQPLAGISVIVRKDSNCFMCPDIVLNTIITDELGYYYYDFYNDTNRVYHVQLHVQAEELRKQAENLNKKRDLLLNVVKDSVKGSRDILMGIYRENPKELGNWGYEVNASVSKSKKNGGDSAE